MNRFETLTAMAETYIQTVENFDIFRAEMDDICAEVERRISEDQAEAERRREKLAERANDSSLVKSVRRLAASEIEKIDSTEFSASEEERAEFLRASKAANACIEDLAEIRARIKDMFTAAKAEIDSMRASTLGDKNQDLRQRWIDGKTEKFLQLCE